MFDEHYMLLIHVVHNNIIFFESINFLAMADVMQTVCFILRLQWIFFLELTITRDVRGAVCLLSNVYFLQQAKGLVPSHPAGSCSVAALGLYSQFQ